MSVAAVTALIADDEPVARAGLRHLLRGLPWLHCVGEAADGPAALAEIQRLQPELVFLDIQMPGLLGTEVLRRLLATGTAPPLVIFTTAYAEHAITAFELGALDYLLKPFGAERLHATLERVRAALGEPCPPALERLAELLARGPLTRLFVRSGAAIVPVAVADVSHFEAVGDYVAVYSGGAEHLLHIALARLEERLDALRFVRIHRGCIVNLDAVARFRRLATGQLSAELKNGRALPVSRSRSQVLRGLAG
ncbi:LytTR family DNA-binding domain-containing protein [Roseateles sp.]|uniref:LytR/AlgR family response regulator transcription factor n=1 Tax=Roseateles sp. TaxID=1971397 RepID=UPI003263C615